MNNGVAVASAKLSEDVMSLDNVNVIYRVTPQFGMPAHYGSRLLIDKEGKLLVSTGERFLDDVRIQSQWLQSSIGKILRINKDGSPAEGNPEFKDSVGFKKEIWAYGNRNPQGLAIHPETGELWETEHGPQGGDELNIIKPGKNYGWPVIAYGAEYTGNPINKGQTALTGMEQPVYYWDPAIAPSGITFYSGKLITEWKNNLFVCALAGQHLSRLVIKNNKVVGEERLLLDNKQRVRDIVEGPDGALWIVTDADDGKLIRISN
jgi:glucose/arabinose dehydrogenase